MMCRLMAEALSGRGCAVCGRRIGVYEPIVVLSGGVLWRTSLAQDPGLTPADVLMHEECAPIHPNPEDRD
jgi:hypothetical protein